MGALGGLLVEGAESVPKDAVRARSLLERAIVEGEVEAMITLGNLLVDGAQGVAKDAERGKALLGRAKEANGL